MHYASDSFAIDKSKPVITVLNQWNGRLGGSESKLSDLF
jgi:hypothetical protein